MLAFAVQLVSEKESSTPVEDYQFSSERFFDIVLYPEKHSRDVSGYDYEDLLNEFIDAKNATDFPEGFLKLLAMIKGGIKAVELRRMTGICMSERTIQRWVKRLKKYFPRLTS